MKTLTSLTLIFALAWAVNVETFSQTPFAKKNASVDDAIKTMKYDFPRETLNKKGSGYSLKPALLEKPVKKIALVTFFVEDVGMSSENEIINIANAWRTDDELAQEFANQFYANGIDALVSTFNEKGVTLLLPKDYLVSDDLKSFFKDYKVEHSILKKERKGGASASVRSSTDFGHMKISRTKAASVDRIKVAPEDSGFKPLFFINEPAYTKGYKGDPKPMSYPAIGLYDQKQATSLGYDLANKLGVDAVLGIYIVVNKMKKRKDIYAVRSISGYLWGPNPVQRDNDKGLLYTRGIFYCGTRAFFNKPLVIKDEKKFTTVSYDGIDNSMAAMADRITHYLETGKRR